MGRTFLLFNIIVLTAQTVFASKEVYPITFTNAEILNENTTRIPFKLVDHLIVIEAQLLGQKGNFIIDTGSETLILNKQHFGLNGTSKKDHQTAGILRALEDPLERRLKEFIISDLKHQHLTSDVLDLSYIEKGKKVKILGIIGYNILKDYEVFIDMYLNQITISKLDKHGIKLDRNGYLEKIIDSIPFTLRKHTICLKMTIGNEHLTFGLDTAAEFNQLNKKSSRKIFDYYFPSKRVMLTGVSGRKIEVFTGKLFRVKLTDKIYFAPMETLLTNLNKMNEIFGTSLDGIVGYEFLRQQRTIINYKKEKLYFIEFPILKN